MNADTFGPFLPKITSIAVDIVSLALDFVEALDIDYHGYCSQRAISYPTFSNPSHYSSYLVSKKNTINIIMQRIFSFSALHILALA